MKIIGTGSSHPSLAVTNDKIAQIIDTSDEWIWRRTGIKQRYVVSDERFEDIAADAAFKAMENSGLSSSDIDFIICSNTLNEYTTPSLSAIIQGIIGASCPCVDINVACAGFVYALDAANAYLQIGKMHNILIICAEEPTRMMNWKDRSTCILFGDGAGAVVVSDGEGFEASDLSTSSCTEMLYQKRGLCSTPFLKQKEESPDAGAVMDGREVYKRAVKYSARDIKNVLMETGITADDVTWFVLHQANKRIIETIARYLKQPMSKFPTDIERYGNTSSASIPILLDDLNRNGLLKRGDRIMFSAFGAGFCSGACLMVWNK
ncbi:MAG: ketoacyl-ACP synthase III [Bacteroidales bacterium]|jgi:3-oxoacyl-[acyl-carrier-protein] synthase-3|nr:ketoacyl-ACP synthase III [Bacteroidales bacterium]MCI2122523.1 ketoacyl-ACP synthase III [Bacteroidales bacterium]MCI2145286.1 ketoacyl-ACP synthase III [Bacteroidales bacterium]